MTTLFEYFKKDFSDTFSVEKGELSINDKNGKPVCNVLARLHLDLAKNAKFIYQKLLRWIVQVELF